MGIGEAGLPPVAKLMHTIMLKNDIVWKNCLDRSQVESWLSNFVGMVFDCDYERHLALFMLSHYVYYTLDEVRHLCRWAFRQFVHACVTSLNPGSPYVVQQAVESVLAGTKFVQLGGPSESGGFLLYFLRQANRIPMSSFVSTAGDLGPETRRVVFVDDVTITGDQAFRYTRRDRADIEERGIDEFVLTLVSTPRASGTLAQRGIRVVSGIELEARSRCLSQYSQMFRNLSDHRERAKQMCIAYGATLYPQHPLGYRNGQYAFGFEHNTPDNSLPIFWSDVGGWTPVMRRYHKSATMGDHDFRFYV